LPKLRVLPTACAGIGATLLLAACAGGSSGASGLSGVGGTASSSATVPSVLKIGINDKINSLDNQLAISTAEQNVAHLTGGNLYTFDPDASPSLQPGLAASHTTSANGLVWTFTLRSGAKFSDGTPVTAADVAASLERALTDKAGTAGTQLGTGTTITTSGTSKVIVTLKSPISGLLAVLSDPQFAVFPKTGLAHATSFFQKPVSAGMYEVQSVNGNTADLAVNPYYWGPKPKVKTIQFLTISDSNTLVSELETGQINFAYDVPPSALPVLKSQGSITTNIVPLYGEDIITIHNADPLLKDAKIRQAMSLALDRSAIVNAIYPDQSTIKPQVGYWPQTMPGYDASASAVPQVSAAKKLLAGTGCAAGCKVALVYSPSFFPFASQLVLLIKQQLAAIGINVELEPQDYTTWAGNIFKGDYQLSLAAGLIFTNDSALLAQQQLTPSGGLNSDFSGFNSTAVNAAVERLTGQGQSTTTLQNVADLFTQNQPWIPMMSYARISATNLPASVIEEQSNGFLKIGADGA
jgi:peptide/nickel transport system substrate-binding protein